MYRMAEDIRAETTSERIERIDRKIEDLLGKIATGTAEARDFDIIEKLTFQRDELYFGSQAEFRKRA